MHEAVQEAVQQAVQEDRQEQAVQEAVQQAEQEAVQQAVPEDRQVQAVQEAVLFTEKRGGNMTNRKNKYKNFLNNGICKNVEHGRPCNRMIIKETCKYCDVPSCYQNFAYHFCTGRKS